MRSWHLGAALAAVPSLATGCNTILDNRLYDLESADASPGADATGPDGSPDASGNANALHPEAGADAPSAAAETGTTGADAEAGTIATQDGGCSSLSDIHSCGSCSNDCAQLSHVGATGLGCTNGQCTYACAPGYADCADAGAGCTTPVNSVSNCGGCGVMCSGSTPVCVEGDAGVAACAGGCLTGQTNCVGTCVDLKTDPGNCGACGTSCAQLPHVSATGLGCSGGTCSYQCAAGYADCGSGGKGCTTTLGTATNCSGCGAGCSGSTPACGPSGSTFACNSGCNAGQTNCSGTCATLSTDSSNCGACGKACPTGQTCQSSACACPSANPDYCGTACTNMLTDNNNCGACSHVCPMAQSCSGGVCKCTNAASPNLCGSSCTNTQTDTNNCGTCGMACTASGETCVGGACKCPSGEIVCGSACVMPNPCGGCGMLSGTPMGTCGTCGTWVCSADKTSVTCNDPGTTNMCPTWCSSHTAPSGVAASDYGCADFDHGSLPSGWTSTQSGAATLSVSTARANSTPDSLLTSVTANSADVATLAFVPTAGASSIKSLSLLAELDPVTAAQIVPTGSSGMDLLRIDCGGNTVRLGYTEQGTDPSGGSNPYTGLYVYWIVIAGAAVAGYCPVTASLNLNQWNTVELDLDVSNLGAINVLINGASATSGCNASNGTDTVATMTVGLSSPSSDTFSWTGYFDNVQAIVRR